MQQKARPTEPNLPAWFSLIPHSLVVTSLPPLNRNTTRLSAYTVTRSMVPHQSFSSNSRGRASLGKGRPCGCLVRDFDFVRVQAVGGVADAVCRIYNQWDILAVPDSLQQMPTPWRITAEKPALPSVKPAERHSLKTEIVRNKCSYFSKLSHILAASTPFVQSVFVLPIAFLEHKRYNNYILLRRRCDAYGCRQCN